MNEKDMKRIVREAQFTRAVDLLETAYLRPLIRSVDHVGENAYSCTLDYASWEALAKKMAMHLPGIVMPTRNGLVWICGGGGPHGALCCNMPVDAEHPEKGTRFDAIVSARNAALRTGYTGPLVWTLGGIGKRLLRYVIENQLYSNNVERLFENMEQGYYRCLPGLHKSGVKLFDVSGYFFSIFSRIATEKDKSLHVLINSQGSDFYAWKDGQQERFQEVISAVEHCKPLRNAMIGAAQGSLEARIAYTAKGGENGRARAFLMSGRPGPLRAYALLCVRTGWELTQLEALTNDAVYAKIDSVMLTEGRTPTVWRAFGFSSHLVSRGSAHVVSRDNYQIGKEKKFLYRKGARTEETERGELALPFHYYKSWL